MDTLRVGEGIYLENNAEYVIVDIIEINSIKYLILSNAGDINDMAVRILDNDSIKGLSNESELKMVLNAFMSKNK